MIRVITEALFESFKGHLRLVGSWLFILVLVVLQQPLLNAFEAHVINVTATIDPKRNECNALSASYFLHREGCDEDPPASDWADEVAAYSSAKLWGAFAGLSGSAMCTLFDDHECPHGALAQERCRAQGSALVVLANIASSRLDPQAILAGADNGNDAFDALGLDSHSTIEEAMKAVERAILDSDDRRFLRDVAYVADQIFRFYQNGNPNCPHCIYEDDGEDDGPTITMSESSERMSAPSISEETTTKEQTVVSEGTDESAARASSSESEAASSTQPPPVPDDPSLFSVVINEVLVAPAADTGEDGERVIEWIELYNRGRQSIDASSFVVYDNDQNAFPVLGNTNDVPTTLGPGAHLVVYDTTRTLHLPSAGGVLTLYSAARDSGGVVLDAHTLSPSRSVPGRSSARLPDGFGDLFDPLPTEGTENQIIPPVTPQPINEEITQENTPDESLSVPEPEPPIADTPLPPPSD